MQRAPSRSLAAAAVAGVTILVASLRALWLVRDHGLLGLGAFPLVLAARADSFAALLRSFGLPLFGDWMPASYFRPVLHLSIVLDSLCFGLEPFGYHATSVLIFALTAFSLHALARALGLGVVGSLVTVAIFVVHPVLGTVLPAPARRSDMLCLLFIVLALAAQVRAVEGGRRAALLPAVFAALAIGSKETGFVAPLLCGVAAWLYAPVRGARARTGLAAVAFLPHFAVMGLAVGARIAVLGSFTGERPIETGAELAMFWRVLEQTLSGRGVWPEARLPTLVLGGALFLTLASAALASAEARRRMLAAFARPAALAVALLVAISMGYSTGILLQPWYLLIPAAGVAWLVAAWAEAATNALRNTRRAAATASGALLLLGLFAAGLASQSALFIGTDDWDRASVRMNRYFEVADRAFARAGPRERVDLPAPPAFAGGGADGPRMRGVVVLAPDTVLAWARLTHPGILVRVNETGRWRPGAASQTSPDERPNLVLIVADDLGYADLGFQGSEEFQTPRFDRLARESVRFTNAYVTSPLCAPSRAGLLTGRDPNRFGYTTATGTYQHQMRDHVGVPLDEVLLPEVLRTAGYATAAVGKWHLGVRPRFRPLGRGFESFFGILAGTHAYFDWGPGLYGPVFRGNERASGDTYLTDAFATEASEFLRRPHDGPFFLYVAFHAVHAPLEAPERHIEAAAHVEPETRRLVAAMTRALDEGVGRILDALEETGRERNTLVVFLNDNGGLAPLSSNAPLRGGKGALFEGGIRVPFLLRWPERVAPGVYEPAVSALDVFPTALAAAGLPLPGDRELDGVDLLPHLREAGGPPPHPVLRWRYEQASAIRRGNWKLVRGPEAEAEAKQHLLFDLAKDVGETRNLAAERPEVARALLRDLEDWTRSLPAQPGRAQGM